MRWARWAIDAAVWSYVLLMVNAGAMAAAPQSGDDPRQVVLTCDAARSDLSRSKDSPTLQIRADASTAVTVSP